MSPPAVLVGAVALTDSNAVMLLGVGCSESFAGACSLVLSRQGQRLRVDLTASQALELGALLEEQVASMSSMEGERKIAGVRDGADVLLEVEGVRMRVAGHDTQRAFAQALDRYFDAAAVSGEIDDERSPHA